ncbi:MAG: nucleotidyltransferase domain-containing protein [Phycisphaerales bacterium]|nr:nucleotidyltransferase domain-containing protein [Phycisphaerales bacterium]
MIDPIGPHRDAIAELCRRHHVRRLWVFGSACRADFDPCRSDIDFLVEFQSVERRGLDDVYFKLRVGLEACLRRPVDLVEVGCVTNHIVEENIRKQQVPLYVAA